MLELTEQVAAAMLITVRQGLALRYGRELPPGVGAALRAMVAELTAAIPFIDEDRRLDIVLRALLERVRRREWGLY